MAKGQKTSLSKLKLPNVQLIFFFFQEKQIVNILLQDVVYLLFN